MNDDCFICNRIELIKKGENPWFVTELETGYVVLGDNQYYRGLTFFLAKEHKNELHELDRETRNTFLSEMADVADAMHKAFKPSKINYELLGNRDNHLHWWLVPRHADDPNPKMPIWVMPKEEIFGEDSKPSADEMREMAAEFRKYFA